MQGKDLRLTTKTLDGLGLKTASLKVPPLAKPSPVIQFAEACINRSGSPEHLGLEDALVMTKMIEAVYHSDRTGTTIPL
jgi:hypothetical protein